jgi:hypothetical protein
MYLDSPGAHGACDRTCVSRPGESGSTFEWLYILLHMLVKPTLSAACAATGASGLSRVMTTSLEGRATRTLAMTSGVRGSCKLHSMLPVCIWSETISDHMRRNPQAGAPETRDLTAVCAKQQRSSAPVYQSVVLCCRCKLASRPM